MAATALDGFWVGLPIKPCRSFGMFCEDDEDEIHRRLDDILRHTGHDFRDLDAMRWTSPVADDNTLVRFSADGEMHHTERWDQLYKTAQAQQAELVIVDTAADLYGGNENDRAQVSRFIKQGLGKIARELNCAVLCNAHPSKSSVAKGAQDFDSGSTAWTGSARSRWAMLTPRGEDGKVTDPTARVLSITKANYSATGDEIELRWDRGVFVTQRSPAAVGGLCKKLACEMKLLDLIGRAAKANVRLSGSPNAGNYAPKRVRDWPDGQTFTVVEYRAALNRLLDDGRVVNEPYGPPSARTEHLVIPPIGKDEDDAYAE